MGTYQLSQKKKTKATSQQVLHDRGILIFQFCFVTQMCIHKEQCVIGAPSFVSIYSAAYKHVVLFGELKRLVCDLHMAVDRK